MLELKVPSPMSVISKPRTIFCNTRNILELADSLPNVSSQQVKRNVIITNKNGKYRLTNELPNNERLKKISKLHGIIV